MMTGWFPNRSGMTTVSFQGQGGGSPTAERTLASVLKQAGYQTFFSGNSVVIGLGLFQTVAPRKLRFAKVSRSRCPETSTWS